MERVLARTAISVVFLVFLSSIEVQGRNSHFSSPDHLVSDGSVTNDGAKQGNKTGSSILQLKGLDSSEEQCEHMYGFLPCSESVFGHLFLIIVYEYLLYHGETYLLSGGGRIFEILGTGFFGASAFPVIAQLPESLILLVTGLFSSDEGAQENVLTGVGMVAGSTIFNLTLLWGTCLFLGRQVFVNKTNSIPVSDPSAESQQKKPPSLLSGYGVTSDAETSFTAKIMLVSVVPFIIILAPKIFNVSYNSRAYNIDILVTLFALIVLLLAYFSYQFSHSSIQDRRLDYLKVEHQTHVLAVINHVQEYVPERLLDDHGAPNEDAISRLFQKLDKDGDQQLSHAELTELFNRIKLSKSVLSREKVMENILNELDHDGNEQISLTEFMKTVKHWLHTTMCAVDEPASHSHDPGQPIKHLDEAITLVLEEQEKLKNVKKQVLEQVRHMKDGEANESAIIELFERLDVDKSKSLTQSELKALLSDISADKAQMAEDEALMKIFEDLDTDGNEEISLEEFTIGLKKWIKKTGGNTQQYNVDRSARAWGKAIFLLVVGIVMLAVLAEPLIHSVQKFATSADIPSFYVAFVLVPLATSARTAISAIRAVRDKIPKNTRLTFSEIYDGVFMNNVLGFSVLLSVVYFRGLVWHFSAEVMIVVIVCSVMGLIASFISRFPVWIMFIAYSLYPLSLIIVYLVDDYFWLP
ncbi:sodium/calcium exchanger NCL1 [Daucus carota subsp. sativus]|uniref:sodium/calcium exchanger NCL1 n=1 Tax=Daucus carota subsp. sativus TaxID=79200 RepID=UPI0007F02E2D|nr:PREDICTED: uncharacterized protein LOC108217941 [Daucus carota subsp. sativus]